MQINSKLNDINMRQRLKFWALCPLPSDRPELYHQAAPTHGDSGGTCTITELHLQESDLCTIIEPDLDITCLSFSTELHVQLTNTFIVSPLIYLQHSIWCVMSTHSNRLRVTLSFSDCWSNMKLCWWLHSNTYLS